MMVPWPQYGHRRGSICNGISLTPDWTCFRSLVNATKRTTGVVARLALDHLCRVRIARLAFPCPQNQYRTKKEYIFPPSSRRILPQSTRLAGLERNNGPHSPPHIHRSFHRSEEHTSELQSLRHLVCRLL